MLSGSLDFLKGGIDLTNEDLMKLAQEAAQNSYSPYSKFSVGAALLTKSGRIYKGCNVENASFGATICAERTAVVKAVSDREHDFEKIAVYTKSGSSAPCGICRQVLSEFSPHISIVYKNREEKIQEKKLEELLPDCFSL